MAWFPQPLTEWLTAHNRLLIGAYLVVFVTLALYGFHRSTPREAGGMCAAGVIGTSQDCKLFRR
jgi:hypothetical protein